MIHPTSAHMGCYSLKKLKIQVDHVWVPDTIPLIIWEEPEATINVVGEREQEVGMRSLGWKQGMRGSESCVK